MNPFSAFYGAIAASRNSLYDRGTISSRRLTQPVVSVGNLSAGGAGKTPFVIVLGELLTARGVSFDVLSRGYGRKTRGVLIVDPNGSARHFGDEPLLIARRLNVPVVVGESRHAAGQLAERRFHPQLHILDDGFQHRALARDFDIVLMTERDFTDQLLPLGRLREPLSSLRRADAIVLPASFPLPHAELQSKPIWRISRNIELPAIPAASVVFCGIARPEQFFAQVRSAGVTPAAEIEFPDHHAYGKDDVEHLLRIQSETRAGGFLTTEKDAINLGPLQSGFPSLTVASLRLTLENPANAVDAILTRITERKPGS